MPEDSNVCTLSFGVYTTDSTDNIATIDKISSLQENSQRRANTHTTLSGSTFVAMKYIRTHAIHTVENMQCTQYTVLPVHEYSSTYWSNICISVHSIHMCAYVCVSDIVCRYKVTEVRTLDQCMYLHLNSLLFKMTLAS